MQHFGVVHQGIPQKPVVRIFWVYPVYTMLWKIQCLHNQCNMRVQHDGKVKCNTFEYTTDFLYYD